MNTATLQRRLPVIAMAVALLLVALMVTRTSQAAFTATTDNTGNSFSAGSVTLTDNDLGSAMFTLLNMAPGDSQTDCIEVTYSGSITSPQPVVLYSGGFTDTTGNLSAHLNLTVVEGDDGATCAAFSGGTTVVNSTLAAFDGASSDYATGSGGWTPAGTPDTRAYQFTVELDTNVPSGEQGSATDDVAFVWEVQG